MSLDVLIVDDEAPARRRVRALLADAPSFAVVGEAQNGLEAVESIQRLRPGLVLLDVQMPGMSGFEVIQSVGADAMPKVVFVTAYDEFAVQAFAVEAIDYLVKPLDAVRFAQALARVERCLSQKAALGRLLGSVLPERRYLERLIVRRGDRLLFVPVSAVERFSADGNYVEVHTRAGSHLVRDTLAHVESQLDPARFVRVHRGEIIAVEAVREVEPCAHGDSIVVLHSGASVRMSRRFADRLRRPGGGG